MWRVPWWNKSQTSTICVSQDTLRIETDCLVILSCFTAGNFISQFCDCDRPCLQSEAMQINFQRSGSAVLHGCSWNCRNWFLSFRLNSAPKLQHNWTALVCSLELSAFSRKKATKFLTTPACMKSYGATVEVKALTPMPWSNNNSSNLIPSI